MSFAPTELAEGSHLGGRGRDEPRDCAAHARVCSHGDVGTLDAGVRRTRGGRGTREGRAAATGTISPRAARHAPPPPRLRATVRPDAPAYSRGEPWHVAELEAARRVGGVAPRPSIGVGVAAPVGGQAVKLVLMRRVGGPLLAQETAERDRGVAVVLGPAANVARRPAGWRRRRRRRRHEPLLDGDRRLADLTPLARGDVDILDPADAPHVAEGVCVLGAARQLRLAAEELHLPRRSTKRVARVAPAAARHVAVAVGAQVDLPRRAAVEGDAAAPHGKKIRHATPARNARRHGHGRRRPDGAGLSAALYRSKNIGGGHEGTGNGGPYDR